jgi:hypothetical protein
MKLRFAIAVLSLALIAPAFAQSGEDLPSFSQNMVSTATAPVNGTNEIQTITIGGTPTAGSFTLTYNGNTTGAITWSATNATLVANIDAALEALGRIGTGGVVTAVGSATAGIGTFTVTFSGTNVAKTNVALMTATSSLTGTSPTLAVATTTAGVNADGKILPKGTLDVALDTGLLYQNTGTPPNPVWVKVADE